MGGGEDIVEGVVGCTTALFVVNGAVRTTPDITEVTARWSYGTYLRVDGG
jgi:hypothetical protein